MVTRSSGWMASFPKGSTTRANKARHRRESQQARSKQSPKSKPVAADPEIVKRLRKTLISAYCLGMPATFLSEITYYLTQLGLPFGDLGLNPDGFSFQGNASRKVLNALRMGEIEDSLVAVSVPLCSTWGLREWQDVHHAWVPDLLLEEFMSQPAAIMKFLESYSTPNWDNHELRLEAERCGDIAVPFGVFIDGVAYQGKGAGTRESCIVAYLSIVGFPTRRLIMTIPKQRLCGEANGCCCRGRCTLDQLDAYLASAIVQASTGVHAPSHFGDPWLTEAGPKLLQW